MRLIIYGDFNCPFSALASERAERLEAIGVADVQWQAVQHLADLPVDGQPVDRDLAVELADELDHVRSMLRGTEAFPIRVPALRPNTESASRAHAAVDGPRRRSLRSCLFHAYWFDGLDIGDPDVLAQLDITVPGDRPRAVREWQTEWAAMDDRMVPMMRLPNGYVSRGLRVLARLSKLLDDGERMPTARRD